jgi:Tol biopolymer transport system component
MRKGVLSLASTVLAILVAAVATVAAGTLAVGTRPARAAFPGTNGKIVFASNRHGGWEIYTKSPARNNLKRLTDNASKNVTPSWSADGKRIAFSSGGEAFASHDIFVMNANGSGRTLVTNERKIPGTSKWGDTAPSFSPNGHRIAFIRCFGLCRSIYTIRTDGSNLKPLASVDIRDESISSPAWSPDGPKILYAINTSFPDFESILATESPDGSNWSMFYEDPVGSALYTPDWSPDGSRVVFASAGEIYETVGGTEATRLTTNQASDQDPAYSPGGGKIVYSSNRDGDYDLYIKNADGTGKPQRLTNAPGDDTTPSWQPIH